MEAPVKIRSARPDDAERLAEFRFEFRSERDPVTEDRAPFLARCRRWMARRIGDDEARWCCWVAETSGELVGHVWIELVEKVPNPVDEVEQHAYLTNMYVTPDERGQGIGSRLLDAGLGWCRRRRIGSVILWPTERSRSLYARHGFGVTGDLLELPIHPASCGTPEPR